MSYMTKSAAKELAIELWQYLADHPEIARKWEIQRANPELWERIKDLQLYCPLCEVFEDCMDIVDTCPLAPCSTKTGLYTTWTDAPSADDRRKAALAIVDAVTAWEV